MNIVSTTREDLELLRAGDPGHRFRDRYRRHRERQRSHSSIMSYAYLILGAIIAVGSLLLAPLPGPGWGTALVGLGIIAGEYKPAASFLDRSELAIRRFCGAGRDLWRRSGIIGRAGMLLSGAIVLAAIVVVAVRLVPLLV